MPLNFKKEEKILTKKSKFTFGKYRGKKIGEVVLYDASYIVWCIENIEWFTTNTELEDIAYENFCKENRDKYEDDELYLAYDPYYD